jgi:hypothetical protein
VSNPAIRTATAGIPDRFLHDVFVARMVMSFMPRRYPARREDQSGLAAFYTCGGEDRTILTRCKQKAGNRRRWLRRLLIAPCAASVVLLVLVGLYAAVLLLPVRRDPSPGFVDRKGELLSAEVTLGETLGDTRLEEVQLTSSSGLQVEVSVRIPIGHPAPHPAVLLLGGQRTGRDAVRLVEDTGGVILAAVSYPYHGNRDADGLALLAELPRMQGGILDTPPAVLLALDWLMELPSVDAQRVELAGVSLGAFVVSVPGALDERVSRVWLIHGAARPAEVLDHGLKRNVGFAPVRRMLSRFLGAVVCSRHLAPERWAGRIAPRPVIAVNAVDDESLPRTCIEDLHGALGEPAEVIWMPGGHVTPRREETVAELARLILSRVGEPDTAGKGAQN